MGTSRTTTYDSGHAQAGADDERAPAPGDVIGRYRIVDRVGTGAMGRVYSVEDTERGGLYALKVLRARFAFDADLVSRFVLEAEALQSLAHANVVAVKEIVDAPPWPPAFAMELLRGRTLAEELGEVGAFAVTRAARVVSMVADALWQVHARDLVHRDVKPDNVFLHQPEAEAPFAEAPGEQVKLLDFGVAKTTDGRDVGHRTAIGRTMGTIGYMAPEQFMGAAEVGPAADVYGLGVMAYELLTARLPFVADNDIALLRLMTTTVAAPPSAHRPAQLDPVPAPLDELVLACLRRDPRERPQDMATLVARFSAFGS